MAEPNELARQSSRKRTYIVTGWQRVPMTCEIVARNAKEAREKLQRGEWVEGSDVVGWSDSQFRGIEVRRDA